VSAGGEAAARAAADDEDEGKSCEDEGKSCEDEGKSCEDPPSPSSACGWHEPLETGWHRAIQRRLKQVGGWCRPKECEMQTYRRLYDA
jgi:hypothetical protein